MVKYMTMKIVNVHEIKARLSEYLDLVERGERVLICRRNQPVAELRAVPAARSEPRSLGGGAGIELPASFFDPLPDEMLDGFSAMPASGTSAAAETQGSYDVRPSRGKRTRKR